MSLSSTIFTIGNINNLIKSIKTAISCHFFLKVYAQFPLYNLGSSTNANKNIKCIQHETNIGEFNGKLINIFSKVPLSFQNQPLLVDSEKTPVSKNQHKLKSGSLPVKPQF